MCVRVCMRNCAFMRLYARVHVCAFVCAYVCPGVTYMPSIMLSMVGSPWKEAFAKYLEEYYKSVRKVSQTVVALLRASQEYCKSVPRVFRECSKSFVYWK
jgi:hypothetical protein